MVRDFRGQRLGTILLAIGAIDAGDDAHAALFARARDLPFGEACVRLGLAKEPAVVRALSLQTGAPSVSIGEFRPDDSLKRLLPGWLARRHRVLPLAHVAAGTGKGKLIVALSRPNDVALLDELAFVTGCRIAPVVAADSDLDQALIDVYGAAPFDARTRVDLGRGPGIDHVVARYF
ncbi:MAG TPA: hypothetical protein VMV18_13950 [bacterium]|nr:hypothetical protein [bacterium]